MRRFEKRNRRAFASSPAPRFFRDRLRSVRTWIGYPEARRERHRGGARGDAGARDRLAARRTMGATEGKIAATRARIPAHPARHPRPLALADERN